MTSRLSVALSSDLLITCRAYSQPSLIGAIPTPVTKTTITVVTTTTIFVLKETIFSKQSILKLFS